MFFDSKYPIFFNLFFILGGSYKILIDEKKQLLGIYWTTEEMRLTFRLWPEIIFFDSTYKLTNIGFVLTLIHIEDSNGHNRVVASALVASEDELTIRWIFKCFEEEHKDFVSYMKFVMSDKEPVQRKIFIF